MSETDRKPRFMQRQWEELKKAGGIAFPVDRLEELLQGNEEEEVLSRDEVIKRVKEYFASCIQMAIDEETETELSTWVRNPTKTGLALALGIDKQTLLDYVKGLNCKNEPFSIENPNSRRIINTSDFDILRRAYQIIEDFYEQKLGENRNNAGVMYWLNNAHNSKWSNEQEFKFGVPVEQPKPSLSNAELPRLDSKTDAGNTLPLLKQMSERAKDHE